MFRQVEAARSLARRVMIYNTTSAASAGPVLDRLEDASARRPPSRWPAPPSRSIGGNGLSREYPIEKLLRDARASMIEDGCNEILSLVGAAEALNCRKRTGRALPDYAREPRRRMELREVIGRRRSIRFLLPLQAGRAREDPAHARGGAHRLALGQRPEPARRRGVPRRRAQGGASRRCWRPSRASRSARPGGDRLVPGDRAVDEQSDRLRELLKAGALGFGEGKEKALEEKLIPIFDGDPRAVQAAGPQRGRLRPGDRPGHLDGLRAGARHLLPGDAVHGEQIRQNLGLPETLARAAAPDRGLPAESPEAGGQRPG